MQEAPSHKVLPLPGGPHPMTDWGKCIMNVLFAWIRTLKGNSSSRAFCNYCWAGMTVWFSFCPILLPNSPFYKRNTPQQTPRTLNSISEVSCLENLTCTEASGHYYRAFQYKHGHNLESGRIKGEITALSKSFSEMWQIIKNGVTAFLRPFWGECKII